jgi:hypothetical protein
MAQLAVEYDPRPPLDAGSPSKAPAQMAGYVRSLLTTPLCPLHRAGPAAATQMRAESGPASTNNAPAAAKWGRRRAEGAHHGGNPASASRPALPTAPARARNGLGVAALVIGVASLVAAISFLLFPLGLVGGLVGLVIAIIALTRGRHRGATNSGQAIAGLVCSVLALIVAIGLTVQLGTWAARNTGVFTRFDNCIAHAGNRADVSACIARFADEVRQ